MPIILAIDTSTDACSCALHINGSIREVFELIPRQHASKLLPMIKSLLEENSLDFSDLDAIAYGQGPGSFTGLRIAAGVTQGIAYSTGVPVIPVSSLASLVFQVQEEVGKGLVFSTLDARINEVYWGFYRVDETGITLAGKQGLCKPELLPVDIIAESGTVTGVGSGMNFKSRMPAPYQNMLIVPGEPLHPRAGAIAALAAGYFQQGIVETAEQVNPVYLRDKVTHT